MAFHWFLFIITCCLRKIQQHKCCYIFQRQHLCCFIFLHDSSCFVWIQWNKVEYSDSNTHVSTFCRWTSKYFQPAYSCEIRFHRSRASRRRHVGPLLSLRTKHDAPWLALELDIGCGNCMTMDNLLVGFMQWWRDISRHYAYRNILRTELILLLWHRVEIQSSIPIFPLYAEWESLFRHHYEGNVLLRNLKMKTMRFVGIVQF